jgi:hypothetical protein
MFVIDSQVIGQGGQQIPDDLRDRNQTSALIVAGQDAKRDLGTGPALWARKEFAGRASGSPAGPIP